MDFSNFSSKDAIILAIIAIAIYVLVSLLRWGLNRRRIKRNQQVRKPLPAAEAPPDASGQRSEHATHAPAASRAHRGSFDAYDAFDTPDTSDAPRETSPGFSDHLLIVQLESAVAALRLEVADLREMLTELQTTRHVSPQYAEAMVMARRGMDALSIAEHCTISIGEAELVAALSRNRQEYENHEEKFDEHD